MLKSMTGYGRGEYSNKLYGFKVELKSINHRYNDISIRMPRHINYLEEEIRKIIKGKIHRGKIDVFINLEYIDESAIDVKVDIPLAISYKNGLETLLKELNIDDKIRLNNILGMSEVVRTERREVDENLIWESLRTALNIALENLMDMKSREGLELKEDMELKLSKIEEALIYIEERSPIVVDEYKEKLKDRIENILEDEVALDDSKLSNEVVFFADRSSIDEEIVRLKSHIKQFKLILEEENSVGRKLEFLLQELNREVNTIGSKANDVIISKYVVELKSELEKIREQVQNIE